MAKGESGQYGDLVSHLQQLAKNDKSLCIFCHDNPDMDCIAAALALRKIGEKYKVKSTIYYGGEINHSQNKAMINVFEVSMVKLSGLDQAQVDFHKKTALENSIALVDTSCFLSGNCHGPKAILLQDALEEGDERARPDIVIDHHEDIGMTFDIPVHYNKRYGSCAAIFVEMIRELKMRLDSHLATALYLGIIKDTDDLKSTTVVTENDIEAANYLKDRIDLDMFQKVINCPKPRKLLELEGLAKYKYFRCESNCVVSGVGFIKSPHSALPAEIADGIMRYDQVDRCVLLSIIDNGVGEPKFLVASFRCSGDVLDADDFIKRIFGKNGGGRRGSAGAKKKLDEDYSSMIDLASDDEKEKLFSQMYNLYADKILNEIKIQS